MIDQIAAGEVVERPASVVKELLENALDAGATSIDVFIEDGGRQRILVRDNGVGMSKEDATLAVHRHATSKIASMEDLQRVETLGFRGEALPSIAAVSRFLLTTRERDALEGTRVHIEGGAPAEVSPTGCPPGTAVEVSDLFYNVPARQKFLRARQTESSHIYEVCLKLALGAPSLRLSVFSEGKPVRQYLPVARAIDRARDAFRDVALQEITAERDGLLMHTMLGPPETARNGARYLYLFVNGRAITDRKLARAVSFAYGSVLPPGRYPQGIIDIRLPPDLVDINAHPQKAEVRFSNPRELLDTITRTLSAKLGTTAWGRAEAVWNDRLPPFGPTLEPADATPQVTEAVASYETLGSLEPTGYFGSMRVLGQVRKMLLVCEGTEGLLVIDQHAADERIRYSQLRAAYDRGGVKTQQLLFPERLEVEPTEAAELEHNQDEIASLGFELDRIGDGTIAIRAVPALLSSAPPDRLIRHLVAELERHGERVFGDAVDTVIATMACHAALRSGDVLSIPEAQELLKQLDDVEDFGSHCPHGRPVVVEFPFRELEKQLGR